MKLRNGYTCLIGLIKRFASGWKAGPPHGPDCQLPPDKLPNFLPLPIQCQHLHFQPLVDHVLL